MSAFLDLLNAYAIWIYIACVVGILFAIKSLFDSRRQARTTMFTLEQEQASDRAFRAVLWMLFFMVAIGAVTAVNTFVTPTRPAAITAIARQTPAVVYTPPVIPPTFTAVPTLTAEAPTLAPSDTPQLPTDTPAPTRPATVPPTAPPTAAPQQVPPTAPPATPASLPPPALIKPTKGEPISSGWVKFIWNQDNGLPGTLGSGLFYKVTVQYKDKDSGGAKTFVKCVTDNSVDTRQWGPPLSQAQGTALDAQFTWSVVIMQVPGGSVFDCDAGAGTPASAVSETWTFFWH